MDYHHKDIIIEKYNLHLSYIKNPDNFIFMNYGYADLNLENYPIQSKSFPFPYNNWYYQSNLYTKVIELSEVTKGKLLDISCGRGGGASLYKKFFNFEKVYGLDINPTNINFAKNKFKEVEFIVGDSVNLPFSNNSLDIITNVEALAYYHGQLKLFLQETNRVLKPQGILSIAQYSPNDNLSFDLNTLSSKYNFSIIKEVDISLNVKIASSVSKHRFSYIDSEISSAFSNGENSMLDNIYKIFILQKYGV